jgi:hypothetical protein
MVVVVVVRTVPFGERHICFSLNSSMRASSGVMVAHLMPTLYLRIASAESIVTRSSVYVVVDEKNSARCPTTRGMQKKHGVIEDIHTASR